MWSTESGSSRRQSRSRSATGHPGALRRGVPRPRNAGAADERKYRLLQGYKRAGDILIQNALADLYDRDSLIFPAIFNYRHLLSCI
jgi:hypothetical protein